jgi:REP element-mobilizing transposase RayT
VPVTPKRKSPRLQGYDYGQAGAYFATICVQDRRFLFGHVSNAELVLSPAGHMVAEWWQRLPSKYADVEIDHWVVMPNHFHGIVITGQGLPINHMGSPLPTVIGWFKTMATNAYLRDIKERGWESYTGKLWQRSFHDHIIRSEDALNRIREYVLNNPVHWQADTFFIDM